MSSGKRQKRNSVYTSGNRVKFIAGGSGFFHLLEQLIDQAADSIHLQTYIYAEDETGIRVADALMRAAQRNVAVYLLADGYASQSLSASFIHKLKEAGIHFRFFEPVFRSKYYYFGRRLHHKLLVVDGRHAMVGGINISNNYNDLPGSPAWFDFALHIEGKIVQQLCILCWKTWNGYPRTMDLTPCEKKLTGFNLMPGENSQVRMRRNDWVRRKNQVSRSYLEIFRNASSQIIIVSSYFLPGIHFRRSISKALNRGVNIKLLLAGVSDIKISKQAERHMYRWLFRNGIEVYEYQHCVLHGKMAICDDQWLTTGSYNVNNISAFASIELNLDVHDERFVRQVKQHIETIIEKDCLRITEKEFNTHYHLLSRLWQKTCYLAIRLIFFLFTFYFRQRE